ncbi:MAG: carboxypeptidase regulatory-like domain-containing protein [Gemmatimonas sp.]
MTGALAVPTIALSQSGQRSSGILRGTVVDVAGVPIEGAQVAIETGAAESNERGEFSLNSVPAGERLLRVRRLGFRPDSQRVVAVTGRTVQISVVLQHVAITLAAVTITGRHELSGPMAGFFRRRATGSGRFFTRDDIEKRNPARMTDLLRGVPGLAVSPQRTGVGNVRIRGSRCAPVVFLDGHGLTAAEFDLDSVDPHSFEGIEVYSGSASVPVEFQRTFRVSSSCGTILLWSKRGEPRARAPRAATLTPAALIARMLEQKTVFSASDVDSVARLDSAHLSMPVYPPALYESAISGRVLAEFVVSAEGEVDMATFNVVTATDRSFVEAVRYSLREQRFFAASRSGRAVHQVMQLPFNFVPDSAMVRRRR